jgi:hypothetical protein
MSTLFCSDDDISITFMTTVDTRFTTAQLPTPCFRVLTNSNSPTVTKKTRVTTATDAKFTGNPERTCRSAASHQTIGSSYSEILFCVDLRFFFFRFWKSLAFQCVWVKEISRIEFKSPAKPSFWKWSAAFREWNGRTRVQIQIIPFKHEQNLEA